MLELHYSHSKWWGVSAWVHAQQATNTPFSSTPHVLSTHTHEIIQTKQTASAYVCNEGVTYHIVLHVSCYVLGNCQNDDDDDQQS